jgi:hypothetical protein
MEVGCAGVNCNRLSRCDAGCSEHGSEPSVSTKTGQLLD